MVLMPAILDVSKPGTEFLAFFALVGMIVVGCFPDYKADKFQHRGHIAGATMAILFSQTWAAFNFWPMLLAWLPYVGYTALNMVKQEKGAFKDKYIETKPMSWIEIFSFGVIYLICLMLRI